MPRKIRQLVSDLERGGFVRVSGGKGGYRSSSMQSSEGRAVSGHDGDDAQHYREKQVRNALKQVQS